MRLPNWRALPWALYALTVSQILLSNWGNSPIQAADETQVLSLRAVSAKSAPSDSAAWEEVSLPTSWGEAETLSLSKEDALQFTQDDIAKVVLITQRSKVWTRSESSHQLVPTGALREVPEIVVTLQPSRWADLQDFTRRHTHERVAMVVDGQVLSVPQLMGPITEGEFRIVSSFSPEEAEAIAKRLSPQFTQVDKGTEH